MIIIKTNKEHPKYFKINHFSSSQKNSCHKAITYVFSGKSMHGETLKSSKESKKNSYLFEFEMLLFLITCKINFFVLTRDLDKGQNKYDE